MKFVFIILAMVSAAAIYWFYPEDTAPKYVFTKADNSSTSIFNTIATSIEQTETSNYVLKSVEETELAFTQANVKMMQNLQQFNQFLNNNSDISDAELAESEAILLLSKQYDEDNYPEEFQLRVEKHLENSASNSLVIDEKHNAVISSQNEFFRAWGEHIANYRVAFESCGLDPDTNAVTNIEQITEIMIAQIENPTSKILELEMKPYRDMANELSIKVDRYQTLADEHEVLAGKTNKKIKKPKASSQPDFNQIKIMAEHYHPQIQKVFQSENVDCEKLSEVYDFFNEDFEKKRLHFGI
jgi:hypothetical protein